MSDDVYVYKNKNKYRYEIAEDCEEGDEPITCRTRSLEVPPQLEPYKNHVGIVLVVAALFLLSVATFGLMPVLATMLVVLMGTLIVGMVGCFGFMGRY